MTTATQPYDFLRAQQANTTASATQRAAEKFIIDCYTQYANAEAAYRKALSDRLVTLRAEGGPVTGNGDIARGERLIADLKMRRDIAEGMKEASVQAAWRASKDREAELKFIEWSMRRDLADGYSPPDGNGQVYGGRRA